MPSILIGKDPKTGAFMSDGLISANMITFLIAGEQPLSSRLSQVLMFLLLCLEGRSLTDKPLSASFRHMLTLLPFNISA